MVNFFSLFFPELQIFLKPIYCLTRKGRQFIWGEHQQIAFEEIKSRLINLPVLHLPDNKGRIHLYTDIVNLLWAVLYIKFRMANPS